MTISSTKGRVFDLLNGTSDVEIRNCRITGVENGGAYGDYQLVQSATTTEDSITLEHNLFEFGEAGIDFRASAGAREEHIRITDNTFFNVHSDAIYCQYTDGLVVQDNRISSTISGSAGIVLSHAYNSPVVSGNDIRMKAGTPNALQVYRVYGTASVPGRIENNYLYSTGGSTSVGIRQQYADYVNYNYNTVRIENAGSGSLPFYDQNSYAHIHIRNCIFANYTGGLAMHVSWAPNSQINSVNYTDLFSLFNRSTTHLLFQFVCHACRITSHYQPKSAGYRCRAAVFIGRTFCFPGRTEWNRAGHKRSHNRSLWQFTTRDNT
jgi:hypothetical protein